MLYKVQILLGFILLLFVLPMIVANYSNKVHEEQFVVAEQYKSNLGQRVVEQDDSNLKQTIVSEEEKNNPEQVVLTAQSNNNFEQDKNKELDNTSNNNININQTEPKKALVLFTHSQETYVPMIENEDGKTSVYDSNSNIMDFENVIKNNFELNSIKTDFLAVDTMGELKKTNRKFSEAYAVVRPYLVNQIQKNNYNIIIDLHRDSAKRDISTLKYKNESYGKLYFVVGEDNPNYSSNKELAENISSHLNKIIPGVSRGVIGKKGEHVDGIYNQDLSKNMILIELGGIENTQDEINRTISVLSRAISIVLQDPTT